ncbi:MAG: site-specific integrase, partial [Haloarculaceae archaeon]
CDCGYSQRAARQEATHTDDRSVEAALGSGLHPKLVASARSSLFDLSLRVELCAERFATRYEGVPRSRSTVNRQDQEGAVQVQLTGRVYPHCLRSTASSHQAYTDVGPVPLQALLG